MTESEEILAETKDLADAIVKHFGGVEDRLGHLSRGLFLLVSLLKRVEGNPDLDDVRNDIVERLEDLLTVSYFKLMELPLTGDNHDRGLEDQFAEVIKFQK
ncbi:MAG: hypothetical protein WC437_02140 [Patescibacteria group bacterium]|jgi:hypothetical protein|nr:hypothetical protein [Patescibacteria group bacterium]